MPNDRLGGYIHCPFCQTQFDPVIGFGDEPEVISIALFLDPFIAEGYSLIVRAPSGPVNDASLHGDRKSRSLTFSQFTATPRGPNNTIMWANICDVSSFVR